MTHPDPDTETLTLELSAQQFQALEKAAGDINVSSRDLIKVAVQDWLDRRAAYYGVLTPPNPAPTKTSTPPAEQQRS